jgi:predicted PurR-regulated permease PerM
MPDSQEKRGRSSWFPVTWLLASVVLVVWVLHWAREVLIPIALAILATFILAPVVTTLRRRGLGRTLSVVFTVLLAFGLLAAVGTMILVELRALANELPAYRQNIREKIADFRIASRSGPIEKVQDIAKEVIDEINREEVPRQATQQQGAVPVVITGTQTGTSTGLLTVGTLLEPLVTAGLVTVLAIFMLLRREDLRDRLLRLAGYGRLAATTKAIDEAARQVSRYLFRQFLLNAGYGLSIGLGLFFLGLPYAVLWGFLAGVARFIPYVGPWVGALAPIAMSLAVFDNWTTPLLIIGLVVVLELTNNLILEPMLYGQSIGVSEVALLIMMAFWTWLWGPIGLVLAAPLTVCVMVLSKGIPDLEFLGLLLGSEPALEPHHVFYQRLLAKDRHEADEIANAYLKSHSHGDLYERLFIPALSACRQDCESDRITSSDRDYVLRSLEELFEESRPGKEAEAPASPAAAEPILILGIPAGDEEDEIALRMFAESLSADHVSMKTVPADRLVSENLQEVEQTQPGLVFISSLPGSPLSPVRQLCKRLRARAPALPIVLGLWVAHDRQRVRQRLPPELSAIGFSFGEARSHVFQLAPVGLTASPGSGPGSADRQKTGDWTSTAQAPAGAR